MEVSPADSTPELLSGIAMACKIFVTKVRCDAASREACRGRSQHRLHLHLLKGKAVANAHARPSAEWHPGAHLGRPPLLIQPPATLLADIFESLGTDIDCVLLI